MRQYKKLFSVARDARTGEFNQCFGIISRSGIKLQWEIVLRSNQKWFQVLLPCWAATNACHLKNECQYSTFGSPWNSFQGIHYCATPRETDSSTSSRDRDLSQETASNIRAHFQCWRLQEGRRLWVPKCWWSFRRTLRYDSKKQQKSELQLDKFPFPHSFWFWKITFKNQVTLCSDFQSETMLWINEVETVGSLDEQTILAIGRWKGFSKLWDAGREDCSCCE